MKNVQYINNLVEWKKAFSFSHPVKVRFSETDMFGHLNNTVPFTYFEEARIEFFKTLGFMKEWTKPTSEVIPVVANLQCDYLKQVYFDQTINVFVKINDIGNSSMDLHYMGTDDDDTILFTGRGTVVQMSRITGKGLAWSEGMKDILCSYTTHKRVLSNK